MANSNETNVAAEPNVVEKEQIILLECVRGKKGLQLRAMPSQKLNEKQYADQSRKVRKPNGMKLKEGAILAVSSLEESRDNLYRIPNVDDIFNLNKENAIEQAKKPTKDIVAAYNAYLSKFDKVKRDDIDYKKYPCPTIEHDGFYVPGNVWKLLVRNYLRQKNTLIVGPTGCGKTEVIMHLAVRLGAGLHIEDMGALSDPIPALLGTHRIEDGNSIFDYAPMVRAVQEEDMIIQLDEVNRCPHSANNILFPMLDSRRELPISIADHKGERSVAVDPTIAFFATANIGSEYAGTTEIDRAMQDRLMVVELDYPPKGVEVDLLCRRTGLSNGQADRIVTFFRKIRTLCDKGELSTTISTRHAIEVADLVMDNFTLTEALEFVVLPLFEGTRADGEKSTVVSIIISQ